MCLQKLLLLYIIQPFNDQPAYIYISQTFPRFERSAVCKNIELKSHLSFSTPNT